MREYYDYHNGLAFFNIEYKGMRFVGEARCHPDDMDMESERTGLTIAEARATIKLMKFKRNFELIPQLNILQHLYNNICTSKYHDPKAYESKMIQSQISNIEKQITTIETDIADETKYLKEYIIKKDNLYKKIRAKNQ